MTAPAADNRVEHSADILREKRIATLVGLVADAPSGPERTRLWEALRVSIESRSERQVATLERARGLL